MNARDSATMQAYSKAAGHAFRIARESLRHEDGSPITQDQFRHLLAEIMGQKKVLSREMMGHYEAGRVLLPAPVLHRLAHLAGMTLDELMSRAVHQLVYGEWEVIERCRQNPHPSRIGMLVQRLREVDAAEHPARETSTTESERGQA